MPFKVLEEHPTKVLQTRIMVHALRDEIFSALSGSEEVIDLGRGQFAAPGGDAIKPESQAFPGVSRNRVRNSDSTESGEMGASGAGTRRGGRWRKARRGAAGGDIVRKLMVDVADMPLFLAGDGLQLPFGSTATVGLETAALGKVSIPVVPEFAAAKDLAGAGGSKIVFPDIQAQGAIARKRYGVREVEHQIQIPDSLVGGELGFLRLSFRQKCLLERSTGEPHVDAARGGGEEREGIPPNKISGIPTGTHGIPWAWPFGRIYGFLKICGRMRRQAGAEF